MAASAQATVFNPAFPVTEVHSDGGGNTAGSFAAAALMGAAGDSDQGLGFDWEATTISGCASGAGSTNWPDSCNPSKMAAYLGGLTGQPWSQFTLPASDEADALNDIVNGFKNFHSPAVVAMWGQADHWGTITQVTATQSGSVWTISSLKMFDGGPTGNTDGSGNDYQSGVISFSGKIWKSVYAPVTENIDPDCDPCTTDPWYNKYVLLTDPPANQLRPSIVTDFVGAPGVVHGGMSEARAQLAVFRALAAAGVDSDADIWSAVAGRRAGRALEVNGVAPSGARWDFFLVPILSDAGQVVAFVQLAADDGAFESIHVLRTPSRFEPVSNERAEQLARAAVHGESLSPGMLTWDPHAKTPFAKSPTQPYFEFAVVGARHQAGVVRVSLDGQVSRSAQ